jgi:hypothetical protein
MRLASSRNFTGYFDQPQIDNLVRALERAWQTIRHNDITGPPKEAYALLALCVMEEARCGEESQIVLINRAILRFHLWQSLPVSNKRSA